MGGLDAHHPLRPAQGTFLALHGDHTCPPTPLRFRRHWGPRSRKQVLCSGPAIPEKLDVRTVSARCPQALPHSVVVEFDVELSRAIARRVAAGSGQFPQVLPHAR